MEEPQAEKIVNKINREIFESNDVDVSVYCYLHYRSNGQVAEISFLEIELWTSDNDDREYNEKTKEYRPLEDYLRHRINNIIEEISTLKVKDE